MLNIAALITFVAAFFSLAAFADGGLFLLDLGAHFRPQYLVAATVCLIIFVVRKRPLLGCAAAVCIAANVFAMLPYYSTRPAAAVAGAPIRVLLANVRTSNRNYQGTLEAVRRELPAVAAFLEVDAAWAEQLESLADLYPYRIASPRPDNFGIAVFSRAPLLSARKGPIDKGQPPSVIVTLEHSGRPLHIVATHPVPPIGWAQFDARNVQLESVAREVNALDGNVVLLGDLNVSIWSSHFRRLLAEAKLEDTRKGFGILPTWPTENPLLYIPIDHCLLRGALHATNLRTFSTHGSDHFGLIADLQ